MKIRISVKSLVDRAALGVMLNDMEQGIRLILAVIVTMALTACGGGGQYHDFSSLSLGPVPSMSANQSKIIKLARSMLGTPYVYGGKSPKGFDCSGLLYYTYRKAVKITLPRVSRDQVKAGRLVKGTALKPADIVYFKIRGEKSLHVGLYIGHGKFIHAPSSKGKVNIQNLNLHYWKSQYLGARRIL